MNAVGACPHCGQGHPAHAQFCPHTGRHLPRAMSVAGVAFGWLGVMGFLMMGTGVWLQILAGWPAPPRLTQPTSMPTAASAIGAPLAAAPSATTALTPTLSPTPTVSPSPTITANAPTPKPTSTRTAILDEALTGHIAFTCFDGSDDEICLINADGSGRVQLTSNTVGDFYPSLSHDGEYILFARQINGANYEIFRMNRDGSGVIQLTANGAENYSPAYSPDDRQIVFTSTQGGTDQQIWVMNGEGSAARRLTDVSGNADPAWSPDGRFISFASTRANGRQIWVMNADGSDVRQVTDMDDVGGRNAWSADGQSLVFYAGKRATQGRRIHFIRLDSRNLHVFPFEHDSLGPTFSPNGAWIAFTSVRDGQNEIYVGRLDGTQVNKVTTTTQSDYQPRWGP